MDLGVPMPMRVGKRNNHFNEKKGSISKAVPNNTCLLNTCSKTYTSFFN